MNMHQKLLGLRLLYDNFKNQEAEFALIAMLKVHFLWFRMRQAWMLLLRLPIWYPIIRVPRLGTLNTASKINLDSGSMWWCSPPAAGKSMTPSAGRRACQSSCCQQWLHSNKDSYRRCQIDQWAGFSRTVAPSCSLSLTRTRNIYLLSTVHRYWFRLPTALAAVPQEERLCACEVRGSAQSAQNRGREFLQEFGDESA